jgi:hypothetical protein
MRSSLIAALALAVLPLATPFAQTSTAPSGRYVAIGCLSKQGTGAAARYQLTDPRGEKPTVYRLQGNAEQLDRLVGRTVEAAGSLAPAGANGPFSMTVNSLVYVAATCSAPVARSGVRP